MSTILEGSARNVTFANRVRVKEQIVTVSDDLHRISYLSLGGKASHHNTYMQVVSITENTSRIIWVTDLLPDKIKTSIEQMVEAGSEAIKKTLESIFSK